MFLEVVRTPNEFVPRSRGIRGEKKWNEKSPSYAAVNLAHGMIEGQRRKINKEFGPRKDIITVK